MFIKHTKNIKRIFHNGKLYHLKINNNHDIQWINLIKYNSLLEHYNQIHKTITISYKNKIIFVCTEFDSIHKNLLNKIPLSKLQIIQLCLDNRKIIPIIEKYLKS